MLAFVSFLVWSLSQIKSVAAADTVKQLFDLYGIETYSPDQEVVAQAITDIEQDIGNQQWASSKVDEYNATMDSYYNRMESDKADTMASINQLIDNNSNITAYFASSLESMSVNDIIYYDNLFKSNVNKIEEYTLVLDQVEHKYSYKNIEVDIDALVNDLSYQYELYKESENYYVLGDVTDIQFIMPVDRHINSGFGNRLDPISKRNISYHGGTDYRANTGTEVYALFNGVVTNCGWSDTAGNFITVECGGEVRYFVCHLSEILVTKGQEVNQYDLIAKSGGTGSRCTGPHLHLGLYIKGVAYDVDKLFESSNVVY